MSAIGALVLTLALFVWFNRLERTGRSVTVVAAVLGLLLAECVLYQGQNEIPTGIFHPVYEGQSFRLLDILIPIALFARLIQRPRLGAGGAAWIAFLLWLATAAFAGVLEDNALTLVSFHAKAIIYLGALFLTAGVPIGDYLEGRRIECFLGWSAGVAGVMLILSLGGIRITLNLPLVPLEEFGLLGTDAATIFTSLGVIALALGLYAQQGRGILIVEAVVLLLTPVAADQRAAFVALAVSLLIVLTTVAISSRRRPRLSAVEVGLALLGVVALLLLTTIPAVLGNREAKLPFQTRIDETFGSAEETLTTAERVNQLDAVGPLIADRPVFGHGLGFEYVYFDGGFRRFTKTDLTHNIVTDLLVRTGIIGLALFLFALAGPLPALVRGWSIHGDRAAAFGLGVGAFVLGLLAKGMVESIFEKYRLAAFLGLGIGAVMAAGTPARTAARQGGMATAVDRATQLKTAVREPA